MTAVVKDSELDRLRADVGRFLSDTEKVTGTNPWPFYEARKFILSTLCGNDAPPEKYDQALYDRAVEILKDRMEL